MLPIIAAVLTAVAGEVIQETVEYAIVRVEEYLIEEFSDSGSQLPGDATTTDKILMDILNTNKALITYHSIKMPSLNYSEPVTEPENPSN